MDCPLVVKREGMWRGSGGIHQVGVFRVRGVGLDVGCFLVVILAWASYSCFEKGRGRGYLSLMVKREGAFAPCVVVSSISQGIVRADEDLFWPQRPRAFSQQQFTINTDILITPRELDDSQLLLIVLLESRRNRIEELRFVGRQLFDILTFLVPSSLLKPRGSKSSNTCNDIG